MKKPLLTVIDEWYRLNLPLLFDELVKKER